MSNISYMPTIVKQQAGFMLPINQRSVSNRTHSGMKPVPDHTLKSSNQVDHTQRGRPIQRIKHTRVTLAPKSSNVDVQARNRFTKAPLPGNEKPSIRIVSSTEVDSTDQDTKAMLQQNQHLQRLPEDNRLTQVPSLSYSSTSSTSSTPLSGISMSPPNSQSQQPSSKHLLRASLDRSLQDYGFLNAEQVLSTSEILQHNVQIKPFDIYPEVVPKVERPRVSIILERRDILTNEVSFIDWDEKPSRIAKMKQNFYGLRRAARPVSKNDSKPLPPVPVSSCTDHSVSETLITVPLKATRRMVDIADDKYQKRGVVKRSKTLHWLSRIMHCLRWTDRR